MRDILIAGMIGVLLALVALGGQLWADSQAEQRDVERARLQSANAEMLEDLRFVRDHSGPGTTRPFRGMDLRGLRLDYLDLTDADFSGADLAGASFVGTDLSGSTFDENTTVRGADFTCAVLVGASFWSTDMAGATFDRTNLTRAYLAAGEGDTSAREPVVFRDSVLLAAQIQTRAIVHGGQLAYAHIWFSDLTGSTIDRAETVGVYAESTVVWPRGLDLSLVSASRVDWPQELDDLPALRRDAAEFRELEC